MALFPVTRYSRVFILNYDKCPSYFRSYTFSSDPIQLIILTLEIFANISLVQMKSLVLFPRIR